MKGKGGRLAECPGKEGGNGGRDTGSLVFTGREGNEAHMAFAGRRTSEWVVGDGVELGRTCRTGTLALNGPLMFTSVS